MANLETSALVYRTDLMNMIKDIVWKNHYEASKYEKYVNGADAEEYLWAAQRLMEIYSTSQIKQILEYNDFKFQALLDTVESVYKKPLVIMRGYVEYNDYYRKLDGKPPLHANQYVDDTEDYGIRISSMGLPPDLILRLGIEDTYKTMYLHELSLSQVTFLESLGYLRRLKLAHDKDSHYDYLDYMTSKRVFPFVSRLGRPFELLYVPATKLANLSNDFAVMYEKSRLFMIERYYTDAYRNKYEYYEGFVGLAILFMAIQQMNVAYLDTDITREFYDLDSIRVVYRAYSVPFYEDIPVAYHAKIVKAINRLLTYKGSNHIIFDLASLFDYDKLTIYQYYLMKQQNLNTDGTPHYVYDDIYDDDGVYLESEVNYEESFDVHFVKRAIGQESPFESINNPNNDLNYEEVIADDHYWLDDADLREKMYQSEYNFIETKYIGLLTQVSMTKYMYESVYFMRMLFDNKDIFENIMIHNSKIGEDIPIFTAVIYLHALICKKLGWTENFNVHAAPGANYLEDSHRCSMCYGSLPTEPTKIAKLMGFNFKADLTKIIYDCMVMDSRHTISFLDENGDGWYFYPVPVRSGSKWVGLDIIVYEMKDNVTVNLVGTISNFVPSTDTVAKALLKLLENELPEDFRTKYRAGVFSTEDDYAIVFTDSEELDENGEPLGDYMSYDGDHDMMAHLFDTGKVETALDIFHNEVELTPMTAYKVDPTDMYELMFEPINWDVHSASEEEDPAQKFEIRSLGFGLNYIAREIVIDFLTNTLGYNPDQVLDAFDMYNLRIKDASIDMYDDSFDKVTFVEMLSNIDLENAVSVNSTLGISSTYKGIIAIREYIEKRMFKVKDKDAFIAYKHLYKLLMTCDILPEIITKNSLKREIVYETDENGDTIYELNDEGESIPKVKEYRKVPIYETDENGNVVTNDAGVPIIKRDGLGNLMYEHEIATSYADLLEDLDYTLAVRLMSLDSEYDIGTEIDYILVELQRLSDNLIYIRSYGSFNMEVIVEYLYKLIRFFKSVKVQLLDYNIIYVLDNRADNMLKLMTQFRLAYKETKIPFDKSLAIGTFDLINKIHELHIVDESITTRDTLLHFIMLMHLKSLVFKEDRIAFADMRALLEVFFTIFDSFEHATKLTALTRALGDAVTEMKLVDENYGNYRKYIKSICLKLDKIAGILQTTILDYAGEIRFTDDIHSYSVSRIEDNQFYVKPKVPHITINVGPGDPNNAKWWGYMLWNSQKDIFHDSSYGESEGVLSTEDEHAMTFEELEDAGPSGEESWDYMAYDETDALTEFNENGRPINPSEDDAYLDIFHLESEGKGIGVFSTEDDYAMYFEEREYVAPYENLGLTDNMRKRKYSGGIFTGWDGYSIYKYSLRLQDTGAITLSDLLDFFSIRKVKENLTLKDSLILDKYKVRYPDFGFAVPDDRIDDNQVAVLTTEDEEIISDTATNYYGNWEEGTPFERRE